MFVKVTENAENVDEAVEIPVEPEGHILMSTLIAQFPGACGLKFKTEQSAWRGVRVVDEKLLPAGDDAWSEGLVYVVTFPKDSKRKGGDDLDVNSAKSRKIERKCVDLIVLGLPWKSTEEAVRTYFEQYGEVVLCEIKRDASNQSKGFGFVRYKEYQDQCNVLGKKHFIDGRWCDVKIPNSQEPETSRKIFVGRLSETLTIKDLQDYFSQYGQVIDVYIPKPFRAFGFVTFVEADIAQGLCGESHIIKGCSVHVSKADPKDDDMMGGGGMGSHQHGGMMMMNNHHQPHHSNSHHGGHHHHSNQFTHSNSFSNNLSGGKMNNRPYNNNGNAANGSANNGMPSRSQSFYSGPSNNGAGNKYERGSRNNNNQMGNGQYGSSSKYQGGQGGRNKSNNKYIETGDGVNGGRGGMNMMGGMGGMMNPNGMPNGMAMNGMMNGSNGAGMNPMGNNQPMNPNMMPPNGQANGQAGGEQMNAMMNMFNPMMAAFLQQLANQSGNMVGPQDGVNGAPGGQQPAIMPNPMGMGMHGMAAGGPQQQQPMWTQSGGPTANNAPVSASAAPHHHSGSRYKGEKNNY